MDIKQLEKILRQEKITNQSDLDFITNNWDALERNRLESALILKTDFNKDARQKFENCKQKFIKTLEVLEKLLKNIPYFVIRSTQEIPYITYDLDIVVKPNDFWRVQEIFQQNNFTIGDHNKSLSGRIFNCQCNILGDNILPIDVHIDFTWLKSRYFDTSAIFEKTEITTIFDKPVPTWRPEYEILARSASIIFEKFAINYLDFFILDKLLTQPIDLDFIKTQTKQYHWDEQFTLLLNKFKKIKNNEINLPQFLTVSELYQIFRKKIQREKDLPIIPLLYLIYRRLRKRYY